MLTRSLRTSATVLSFLALALLTPRNAAAEAGAGSAKAVANDACAAATPIGFGTFSGDTSGATPDGDTRCAYGPSPDVWFKLSSPTAIDVAVDTRGSDLDTILSVHRGCPGSTVNTIACDDDTFDLQSAVGFHAAAGVDYYIRVAGCCDDATGPFTLNVEESGAVAGTVTDAVSGQPIFGITILVGVESAWEESGYAGLGSGSPDASGNYLVDGLPPGTYAVFAFDFNGAAPTYLFEMYDDVPCNRWDCTRESPTPVVVRSGETTAGVDLALDVEGVLSGTVTDALTGAPIPYANVEFYGTDGELVSSDYYESADASGAFSFGALYAGNYLVLANEPGYGTELYDGVPCPGGFFLDGCDPAAGTPVAASFGATTGGVDFTLDLEGSCASTGTALCLSQNRFRIEAQWKTPDGASGVGEAVHLSGDTGYFWFFSDSNVELVVKVLDACGLPGFENFWVFAAGLTNLEVLLRVTDTASGQFHEYRNPQGSALQPIQDTGHFRTCDL